MSKGLAFEILSEKHPTLVEVDCNYNYVIDILIKTVQTLIILTHLKLWVAMAKRNFKWVRI